VRNDYLVNRHLSDLNPILVGQEACAPGHSFGPTVRKYTLIHYIKKGKGTLEKNGEKYSVHPGEAFLILPEEVTFYYADEADPWEYQWVAFDGSLSARFRELPAVFPLSSTWTQRMLATVGTDMREYKIAALLFQMYAELFAVSQNKKIYIEQVQDYIRALYMQELRVEEIAGELNLDRRYLSRVFKEKTGFSIKEYIIKVRMEEACQRLKSGESVSSAAIFCGYSDVFNFSKMFKSKFGCSPRQWQLQNSANSRKNSETNN